MLGFRPIVLAPVVLCAVCALSCQLLDKSPPPATPAPVTSVPAPVPLAFAEESPPPEPAAPAPAAADGKPVEPGITATGAPTRGTLPKAAVDDVLSAAAPAIQACYDRALKTQPELHGSLSIDFVVGTDGKVAHAAASVADDPFTDAATIDCMLDVMRKLEFPEPKGGRVFLSYPLVLAPTKPAAAP